MKICDIPYEHIACETMQTKLRQIIDGVKNAENPEQVLQWREEYLALVRNYSTQSNLCYIRYSCNTADEFYLKEKDYFDEISPEIESLMTEYGNALLHSPFRKEL